MKIEGQAAIVTGGASGLGGATAQALAEAGAKVTIFDLDETLGKRHAEATGAHSLPVDVTDEEQVQKALAQAEGVNGKARILVNCAGIGTPCKIIDWEGKASSFDHFRKTVSVNLMGTFKMLSQFAARLHDTPNEGDERGIVINTASVAAYEGQIGQAAYAASKGGIVSMTLPAAREMARHAIRVVTIAPGLFRTPALESLPEEVLDSLGGQVPFPRRRGRPDEYAELVKSIIANPMLNGEVIRLDGAIRMASK